MDKSPSPQRPALLLQGLLTAVLAVALQLAVLGLSLTEELPSKAATGWWVVTYFIVSGMLSGFLMIAGVAVAWRSRFRPGGLGLLIGTGIGFTVSLVLVAVLVNRQS